MPNIYSVLSSLGISFIKHEHPAVFTCEAAEQYCSNIPGGRSKNIFLRNRGGEKHYLVVLESSKRLDMKKLATLINESKLSFASPERMLKYLNLTPGSVSPFGLINDVDHHVVVIVDSDLLKHERLSYHPNLNTETLELSSVDFKKFLESTGNKILILDF